MKRPRLDVNLEELDRVLDQAREAPLSEPDYDKLKNALGVTLRYPDYRVGLQALFKDCFETKN